MAAAADGLEEIVQEFLAESADCLDRLDRELVELERDPASRSLLDAAFRALHTVKGNSAALGFPRLESLAHAGEGLLGRLRDGSVQLQPSLTGALLAMSDAMRARLNFIRRDGKEDIADLSGILRQLEAPCRVGPLPDRTEGHLPIHPAPDGRPGADSVDGANGSVRVRVGVLDTLMDLAGELVLARNETLRNPSPQRDGATGCMPQRLKSITDSLQETVMTARMRPIGEIWNQFPRLVRDLALLCGKSVDLVMKGSDTELDRSILEAVKAPLTHVVRNAIDHGIETPERRIAAGKSAAGCLRLQAFHQDGLVHVEVTDDGAGLDYERVRQRAIQRQLVSPEQAAAMGATALTSLVFTPGFSTVETVTSLSGRGVGLDVVKTNIERIGGRVELQTVGGKGTTVHLTLPLTLAIFPALIVGSGGERFAVPQANVLEVVGVEAARGAARIEYVCGAPVCRLRGRLLPLCFLDQELQLQRPECSRQHILVVRSGGWQFGLVVDAVDDSEEIVIKPLGATLRDTGFFTGATIVGDGQVILILDVDGIARSARLGSRSPERPVHRSPVAGAVAPSHLQRWLLCQGTSGPRFALPLSSVVRLEQIPAERVERAGGREVARCRGAILPLLRVADVFHEPERERDPLEVVVLENNSAGVGLIVDRVDDIVEAPPQTVNDGRDKRFSGWVTVGQHLAAVLDLSYLRGLAGEMPHGIPGGRSS